LAIKDHLRTLFGFSFRLIPFSTETGLRVFGKPDESSPVFVTANFDLTVKRVTKYLKNIDCYLLVAPTKGINVWCAAGGDSFNARSVISVVRTSRIGQKVKHRKLILPQLSAPGVDLKQVEKETGWHCEFGPVYAADIPEYLKNGLKKTTSMRRVTFGLKDRLDVGFGCTFIGYLLGGILFLLFQFILGISLFLEFNLIFWPIFFLMYTLYPYTPGRTGWRKILSWDILIGAALIIYLLVSWTNISGYGISLFVGSMVAATLIGLDFGGVAPVTKTDFDPLMAKFGFSNWGSVLQFDNTRIRLILGQEQIRLDRPKCIGCGTCVDVCPIGVYAMDDGQKKSAMKYPSKCTACTACVMQCPTGAIFLVQGHKKTRWNPLHFLPRPF
jgi:NAD-dependent dihydropyrimidine dehydrogenase PreA subunit